MLNEAAVIAEVGQRAQALAAVGGGEERESEGDAALATYLWLLSNHRRDLAQIAADSVRDWRPFFWARKVADDLHLADGSANGNGSGTTEKRTGEAAEGAEAVHREL
jgi:hypothetical protein